MLTEIDGLPKNLNEPERMVLEARKKGVSFCNIPEEEVRWHIDQIMLRGAAIGGCAVPNTEFFAEIIGEELQDFITRFGYAEYTYEEILLALRLNAKAGYKFQSGALMETIAFYGNCFNVDYFSKIIANYQIIRTQLDRKVQNQIDGYEF